MPMTENQDAVFEFLMKLPVAEAEEPSVERIDTHANIVFLAGKRAYKIKRAVKFPFLDYSTLEKREEACKREITHNSHNAPQLYLHALPITRDANGILALDGAGETVEWVVVMNRFDQNNQLDRIAEKGPLSSQLCDSLAAMLALSHQNAPRHPEATAGFYAELSTYLEQNDAAFAEDPELFPPQAAEHLSRLSSTWLERIKPLIMNRGAHGHVRLCHGDAHSRNIVLLGDGPVLFDAIEFSDAMATTDTLYDLAFLLMDLWERGQRPAANLVFNRYFDKLPFAPGTPTSDHEGLAALPFYLSMRAAIRAKIAASAAKTQQDTAGRKSQRDQASAYFNQALAFLDPSEAALVTIGGFSGTGKTTLAYALAPAIGRAPGARVLRTDVERKRRLGLAETEKAPAASYTKEASDAVYAAIETHIRSVLASGHSAIFDAVFASQTERLHVESIAAAAEAPFCGLWLEAPEATLKERVQSRQSDASDATVDVVDRQLDYDLGKLTWPRVNAGGRPEEILKAAAGLIADVLSRQAGT
jgi:uncharacterized protein